MRKKQTVDPGWSVRIGAELVVAFRYPEPGNKKSFEPTAKERRLAPACLAVLGQGPGYQWGALHRDSASWVAEQLGGVVEQASMPAAPVASEEAECSGDEQEESEGLPAPSSPREAQSSLFGGG